MATVDSDNIMRTFSLENLETLREEIVTPATKRIIDVGLEHKNPASQILANPGATTSNKTTLMTYSPKQSLKFYGSRDPRLASAWPDNAILKLESIPHHFTAFSIRNCGRQPCITLHCLDYVTLPPTSSSE